MAEEKYDPVLAIRTYLEEQGGTTEATAGQLLTSFAVQPGDHAGHEDIQRRLEEAGLTLDSPLAGLDPAAPVRLGMAGDHEIAPDTPLLLWAGPQSPAPDTSVAVADPPILPPSPPAPPAPPGGLSGFIHRRPRAVFWWTLGGALLVGIVLGTASASDPQTAKDLKTTKASLASSKTDLATNRQNLADTRGELTSARERIAKLTAKGEVPSLQGKDADDVDSLLADFDWNLVKRTQVSGESPGTIIAQSPSAGQQLKAGQDIQVTVAKAAPPSWKDILTLSGSGSKRTDEFDIPAGRKVRVQYSFSGETNDTIEVKDPESGDDDFGDLIFNEIGAKSGTTRLYGAEGSRYLDISGDSWTIQVQVYK